MKKYHNKIVEVVGYNLHYLENYRNINLAIFASADFDNLTKQWINRYRGNSYDPMGPIQSNIFKCQVDCMVNAIVTATEETIHRRVNEELQRYHEQFKSADGEIT